MRDLQTLPVTEALRRRLLTLVLLTVLVWYTVVVPAPAGAFVRRAAGPRDEDGQLPTRTPPADTPLEELDWPEFIGG